MKSIFITFFIINLIHLCCNAVSLPIVINTWRFTSATIKAWEVIGENGQSALDALVAGCTLCEIEQCDGSVGYGGSPDENGETTLDAMIMDGKTMKIGAVASLRNIKNAIGVARYVLENTHHTLLVGDLATDFAVQMGFTKETLITVKSAMMWSKWRDNNCQPNFWINVVPDPRTVCGPYEPISSNEITNDFYDTKDEYIKHNFGPDNHDTIGMIVIDDNNHIITGTSTNGLTHKIPGRVGDSPIPGAGCYADDEVGAAAATGDGDVMMRFLPSLLAVEFMRNGMTPKEAAEQAIQRITQYYPDFSGAIIVVNKNGEYSAACHGMNEFPYSVYTHETGHIIETTSCI